MKLTIVLLALVLALMACTSMVDAGPSKDQVEAGVKHTKAVIASLGKVNGAAGKETASQKKLRELTAPIGRNDVAYYHSVQPTVDKEVDRTARAVISNPTRDAYLARIASDKQFAKTVSSASSLLNAHNKNFKKMKKPKVKKSA